MARLKEISSSVDALLSFEQSSIRHLDATCNGDYKSANKAYDLATKAIQYLKGENKLELLAGFLDHPNPGVRTGAARYLLGIMEEEAVRVLDKISMTETGITGFNAEMILKEWRKGNLIT